MTTLTINGLEVSCAVGSLRSNPRPFSEHRGRSPRGTQQSMTRRTKRSWSLTTTAMAATIADSLERWCTGAGSWRFTMQAGITSDQGLVPHAGHTGVISTAQSKFGTRSLYLSASTKTVLYTVPPSRWGVGTVTISAWHYNASWKHIVMVVEDAGATITRYVDGAATGTLACVSQSSNVVTIAGKAIDGSSTAVYYDDVVLCNYPWTAAMVAAIYARGNTSATRHPASPLCFLTGTVIGEAEVPVRGFVTGEDVVQASSGGVWASNLRALSLRFDEVLS